MLASVARLCWTPSLIVDICSTVSDVDIGKTREDPGDKG